MHFHIARQAIAKPGEQIAMPVKNVATYYCVAYPANIWWNRACSTFISGKAREEGGEAHSTEYDLTPLPTDAMF